MNLIKKLKGPLDLAIIKKVSLYLRFFRDRDLQKELYLALVRNIDFIYFFITKGDSLGPLETSPEIIWLKRRVGITPLNLLVDSFLKRIMTLIQQITINRLTHT